MPKGLSPLNWHDDFLYLTEVFCVLFFGWLICAATEVIDRRNCWLLASGTGRLLCHVFFVLMDHSQLRRP